MNPFFERRRSGLAAGRRLTSGSGSHPCQRAAAQTMSVARLAAIDRHSVAARLEIPGRSPQILRGRGTYEPYSDLGPLLRIHVADAEGDFDLVLLEDEWLGSIESGEAVGCDFLVHL
jgi:hypothetical protein